MNFQKYNLPIPENILCLDIELQKEVAEYYDEMNNNDKIAYKIAFEHLGTSFNLLKSNGFVNWKRSREKKIKN
jgi:hypothetical protein